MLQVLQMVAMVTEVHASAFHHGSPHIRLGSEIKVFQWLQGHPLGRQRASLPDSGRGIYPRVHMSAREEWVEGICQSKTLQRCMVLRMQGILVSLFLYTGIGSSTNILYVCTVSTPAHTHTRTRARVHVQTHAHVETHTHTCTKHTCVRIYD